MKLSRLNTFKPRKIFHVIDQIKVSTFKGTVVNRALPFLQGGSIKITLTVPLTDTFLVILDLPEAQIVFH